MKLSIVATLYQSEPYINEFYQRSTAVAKQLVGDEYEVVLVNDGSPDNSLDLAIQLTENDSHVIVVDLSRNFGHHKAMMTGLDYAKGEYVFLIDSDLEEEPEWLLDFSEDMQQKDSDVVFGTQEERKGGWIEQWTGRWFYRIFRLFTGLALPENIVTARLMSRRYVDALLCHKEREVFMAGLWHITGFYQCPHIVKKHNTSQTTYSLRRKVALLVNSITSFSNMPLIFIFQVGVFISIVASFYILYLVINWSLLASPPSGWTSIMASIWLLGGMIISFMGIIGVYLSKIFSETKQRPYSTVRQVYEQQSD